MAELTRKEFIQLLAAVSGETSGVRLSGVDLSGLDLRGLSLHYADLRLANLEGTYRP